MEDDAKLKVAPLVEFFQHLGIGGPFVGSAASVHVGADFLCRGMEGKACGDGGKRQMSETIHGKSVLMSGKQGRPLQMHHNGKTQN